MLLPMRLVTLMPRYSTWATQCGDHSAQRDPRQRPSRLALEIFAPPCRKCAFASVYEYRQLRVKGKAMTRTLYALAIAVVCAVFSVDSGSSQAAAIAPLSAVVPKDNGSAMLVRWH